MRTRKPANNKAKVRCCKIHCIPVKKGPDCNVLYVFCKESYASPMDLNVGKELPLYAA